MNAKHTPGPWRIEPRTDRFQIFGTRPVMGNEWSEGICKTNRTTDRTTEEANASLIAAAPDLLEALKAFVTAERDWLHERAGMPKGTFDDPLGDALKLAEAAILKAEGKQ